MREEVNACFTCLVDGLGGLRVLVEERTTPLHLAYLGNGRGWDNPCGLRGRVTTGWDTGLKSATCQL